MATRPSIIITGRGVERTAPTIGAGISGALTFAARADGAASFYVRDVDGSIRFQVERGDDKCITVREVK